MEYLAVEFVSPGNKASFSGVRSLTARTEVGELTVMAKHERSVMSLLPGSVVLKKEDGNEDIVLTSGATLSIRGGVCYVMAEVFLLPEEVSKEELQRFRGEIAKMASASGMIGELSRADLKFVDMVLKK